MAVAEAAEGPYTRLPGLSISTRRFRDAMGRWDRLYASTLLRRSQDWLMLVLCDSGEHFAWAYAAFTAPGPEGPWSGPVNILSCDRPEFYPAPVEFHPAMAVDGVVYAHATSVASVSYTHLDIESTDAGHVGVFLHQLLNLLIGHAGQVAAEAMIGHGNLHTILKGCLLYTSRCV